MNRKQKSNAAPIVFIVISILMLWAVLAYAELFFWPDYKSRMEEMIQYYSEMNYAYFSGRPDLLPRNEEIRNAWKELGVFISVYLETIAQEEKVSQNQLVLEMD